MHPVFNDLTLYPGEYDGAIDEWLNAPGSLRSTYRAMASNVMYDHRVTLERKRVFDGIVGRPCSGSGVQRAVTKYKGDRIAYSPDPDYLNESLNSANFVSGFDPVEEVIEGDVPLARVVDLNGQGLQAVYAWGKNHGEPALRKALERFPENPDETSSVSRWLDDCLLPPADVSSFIGVVLQALNGCRQERPYRLAWATFWSRLEPHLGDPPNPDRWLEVLGLGALPQPHWVIALKYTVAEAGTLVRPTMLEAGWNALHFPSPPQAPLGAGGHCMDLGSAPPGAALVNEYIHQPIEHSLQHWENAGRKCARTTGLGGWDLSEQRRRHHRGLSWWYTDVERWMPFPV